MIARLGSDAVAVLIKSRKIVMRNNGADGGDGDMWGGFIRGQSYQMSRLRTFCHSAEQLH